MRLYTVLFIFLISALLLSAQESPVIKVGIPNYNPVAFLSDQNEATGLFPDLLNQIAEEEGWEIEYIVKPWSILMTMLENADIDLMTSMAYSEERAGIYDFSEETVALSWSQVFQKDLGTIESVLDLEGKQIAVVENDINGENIETLTGNFDLQTSFIRRKNYEEVCRLVETGQADGAAIPSVLAPFYVDIYELKPTTIMANPFPILFSAPKGFHKELLNTIDSYIRDWKKDKTSFYYENQRKWLSLQNNNSVFQIHPYIILSLGTAFILVGISLFSLYLRRKPVTEMSKNRDEKYRSYFSRASDGIYRVVLTTPIPVDAKRDDVIEMTNQFAILGEVNNAQAKMYGLHPADLYGEKAIKYAPDFGERINKLLQSPDYEITEWEAVDYDKKGNKIYLIENMIAIVKDGNLMRIWGTQKNITERVLAEKARKTSEIRYKTLLENMKDGLLNVDMDNRIIYSNRQFAHMVGYSEEDLTGMDFFQLISDEGRAFLEEKRELNSLKENNNKSDPYEIELLRRNGTKLPALVSPAFYCDESEKRTGSSLVVTDISKLKRI